MLGGRVVKRRSIRDSSLAVFALAWVVIGGVAAAIAVDDRVSRIVAWFRRPAVSLWAQLLLLAVWFVLALVLALWRPV